MEERNVLSLKFQKMTGRVMNSLNSQCYSSTLCDTRVVGREGGEVFMHRLVLLMAFPALTDIIGDDDDTTVIIVDDYHSDIIEKCRESLYRTGNPESLGEVFGFGYDNTAIKTEENILASIKEKFMNSAVMAVPQDNVDLNTIEEINISNKQFEVEHTTPDNREALNTTTPSPLESLYMEMDSQSTLPCVSFYTLEKFHQLSSEGTTKKLFNEKISAMKAEQNKNVKMFSNDEYQKKMDRIKQIKIPGHRMVPQDYHLINRFEVLREEKEDQIVEKLAKVDRKDGTKKMYVTYEMLFDAILEIHVKGGKHTGRDITFKRLQEMYANITVQQVIIFIEFCHTCKQKSISRSLRNYKNI